MAELAFAGMDRVVVDQSEMQRSGPSYTVDSVETLRQEHPAAALFLIVGGDQAKQIRQWHRWRDLLRLVTLCVVQRGAPSRGGAELAGAASAAPLNDKEQGPSSQPIEIHMSSLSLSSTDIRRRIAAGRDWATMVPVGVARYIDDQQLYRTT